MAATETITQTKTATPKPIKTPVPTRRAIRKPPPKDFASSDTSSAEKYDTNKPSEFADKAKVPGSSATPVVRRSFHRRIAEKLAMNLSGVRQYLRESSGAGFGVWSSSANKQPITEPVRSPTSPTDYFDSIENVLQEGSLIMKSCSFMDSSLRSTCSPDSLDQSK